MAERIDPVPLFNRPETDLVKKLRDLEVQLAQAEESARFYFGKYEEWLGRVKELEGELERLNRGNDELLRRANRMLAVVETAKKAKDFLHKLVVEETHMSEFYDAFYRLVASLEALEEEPPQEQAVRAALFCGSREITEEAVAQVEQRLEQIRTEKEE